MRKQLIIGPSPLALPARMPIYSKNSPHCESASVTSRSITYVRPTSLRRGPGKAGGLVWRRTDRIGDLPLFVSPKRSDELDMRVKDTIFDGNVLQKCRRLKGDAFLYFFVGGWTVAWRVRENAWTSDWCTKVYRKRPFFLQFLPRPTSDHVPLLVFSPYLQAWRHLGQAADR